MTIKFRDDMVPGDWRAANAEAGLSEASRAVAPLPSAGEIFDQAYEDARRVSNQNALSANMVDTYDEVNARIKAATKADIANPMNFFRGPMEDPHENWKKQVNELRAQHPDALPWDEVLTEPERRGYAKMKEVREASDKQQEALGLVQGREIPYLRNVPIVREAAALGANLATRPISTLAQFAGGFAGSMTSPLDAGVNLLGFGAGGAAKSLLKNAVSNAAVNAAGQMPLSYLKQEDYRKAGLPTGFDVWLAEVEGAAAAGAVIDAGVRGPVRAVRALKGDKGLGGVVFDAVPETTVPAPKAMEPISPETFKAAQEGDLKATREILTKTGAIDNPEIRGALEHAETHGRLDADALARLEQMGVAPAEGMRIMDGLLNGRYVRPIDVMTDVERMRSPPQAPIPDADQARVLNVTQAALDEIRPQLSQFVAHAIDARIPEVEALAKTALAKLKDKGDPADVAREFAASFSKLMDDPESVARMNAEVRIASGAASSVEIAQLAMARHELRARLNPELARHAEALALSTLDEANLSRVLAGEVPPSVAAHIADHVPPDRHAQAFDDMVRAKPQSMDEAIALLDDLVPTEPREPGMLDRAGGLDDPIGAEAKARTDRLKEENAEAVKAAMEPIKERDKLDSKVESLKGEIAKLDEKAGQPKAEGEFDPFGAMDGEAKKFALSDKDALSYAKKRGELHEAETQLAQTQARLNPDPEAAQALYRVAMASVAQRRAIDVYRAVAHAVELGRKIAPEGTKIEVRSDEMRDDTTGNLLDAYYQKGDSTIVLARYAADPAARMGHEVVHALIDHGLLTAKEMKLLADQASKADGVFTTELREKYAEAYKGRSNLDALLDEEAAAHLIDARMKGKAKGPENTVAGRIAQFVQRLRNLMKGYGFKTADDVTAAILNGEIAAREQRFAPLRQWMGENDVSAMAVREPQMMAAFAGESARTANRELLAKAKQMENDGWARHDIFLETGWFRDPGKNWRFEISDRYAVDVGSSSFEMLREMAAKPKGALDNYLGHKELYEAYPQLRKLMVERVTPRVSNQVAGYLRRESGLRGLFKSLIGGDRDPKIELTSRADRNSLLHEVQHAIDDIEGGLANVDRSDPYHNTGYANASFEQSARAVEQRSDLTDRERATRPPWLDWGKGQGRRVKPELKPFVDQTNPQEAKTPATQKEKLTAGLRHNQGPELSVDDIQFMIDDAYQRAADAFGEDRGGSVLTQAISGGFQRLNDFRQLQRELDKTKATPAQRAAAIDLFLKDQDRMRFERRTGAVMFALADRQTGQDMRRSLDALGYYSKLDEVLSSLGPKDKVTAQTLQAKGVKLSEIEARGLKDALAEGKSVPVAELMEVAGRNSVGLNESIYSADATNKGLLTNQIADAHRAVNASPNDPQLRQRLADLQQRSRDMGKPTRWPSYSIDPSNPTYRETVLHLPPNPKRDPAEAALHARIKGMYSGGPDPSDTVARTAFIREMNNLVDQYEATYGRHWRGAETPAPFDFTSKHFPEPNIIGHLMTSMVKHEGKPVYLVDQIQSDWGQKLRDGGVRDEAKAAQLRKEIDAKFPQLSEASRRGGPGGNSEQALAERRTLSPEQLAELSRLRAELNNAVDGATGNPLVNTTDQWVNTTLRRAIRQAAEADAEYIAIPHGDTVLSYNPGDTDGMRGFYGTRTELGIVPKNLRNLLQKIDKASPAPQRVEKLETTRGPEGWQGEHKERSSGRRLVDDRQMHNESRIDKSQTGFTLFPLTDKIKQSVKSEGQVMFAFAGVKAAENLAKKGERRPLEAMQLAARLKAQGADPVRIYERTNDILENSPYAGVHYGADGLPRFEITDDALIYAPGPKRRRLFRQDGPSTGSQRGLTGPQITHAELLKAYPELGNRRIDTSSGPGVEEDGGWSVKRVIAAGPDEAIPAIVAHEMQHEIQIAEGFARGSNLKWAKGHPDYDPPNLLDRAMDYDPAFSDIYKYIKGEVEARNVEKRLRMTAEERRRTPPWQTQDAPYSNQIDNAKPWQRTINRLMQPFWSSRLGEWLEANEYLQKAGTKEAFADWLKMRALEAEIQAAEAEWNVPDSMIGHNSNNRGQVMFAFAGERAKTADLDALARAKQMDADGTDRKKIWTDTGWFKGVDGKWRFEIDDSAMSATKGDGYGLRGHLRHDQLADAYPQSASLPTSVYSGGNYGLYDVNGIEVRSYPQNYRSYAAHELQHFVQDQENFARGQGLGNYRRGSDEVEARAVQKRIDMSPEERRSRPPWEDYDVPEDQQIVRFADGQSVSQHSYSEPPPVDGPAMRGTVMFAMAEEMPDPPRPILETEMAAVDRITSFKNLIEACAA